MDTSMDTWMDKPWLRHAVAALSALALAVFLALVKLAGGWWWQLLAVTLAAVLCIWLPGRFWHRLLRLESFLPGYRLPLSLVLGLGSLAVCYCFCMRLGVLWLLRVLPPALGLAEAWLSVRGAPRLDRPRLRALGGALAAFYRRQYLLVGLAAALVFVYGWCGVTKYAHPSAVGQILLNQDFLWNVGNAESFLIAFPPQDIRFYNVRLTYHYLTEMTTASLSVLTGIPCYDIMAFCQQPLLLCALVACVYRFGLFFFKRADGGPDRGRALLLPFVLFCFGCASLWKILPNGLSSFWNSDLSHLITNINSQATAILVLTVFSALFLQAAQLQFRIGPVPFVVVVACFVLLCFAKGPVAAIVACAVVLTVLFLLVQRRAAWQGLLLGGCLAGLFVGIYFAMYASGANNSMTLTLSGTLEKSYFGNWLRLLYQTDPGLYRWMLVLLVPVQSLLTLPAVLPLFLRGAWGDLKRLFRLDATALYPTACAVGGLLAFFLYNHPAMSQVYFLLMAIFFFDVLALRQLDALRPLTTGGRARRALHRGWTAGVAFLAVVGLTTAAFNYVNLCGSGLRQLLFNYDILEKYPYDCVMTADDEAAALWLRQHTDAADCRFATNRIHTGGRMEGISNLYSALSGRQGFMEGFQYAVTNMGVSEPVVRERIAANEQLFSADTPSEQLLAICRNYGITHLVYSRQMVGDESQLAAAFPCVYNGRDVRIYEIPAE